jgi:phosphoglucosamine mutase
MKSNGVRGPYGAPLITESSFYAIPFVLKQHLSIHQIVVAHDPRPSSYKLYQALLSGAKDAGLQVYDAGLLPTPVLAKWCFDHNQTGLIVTASHNPVSDNGFKIIGQVLSSDVCNSMLELVGKSWEKCSDGHIAECHQEVKNYYLTQLLQAVGGVSRACLVDAANGSWSYHLDLLEGIGLKPTLVHKINPGLINTTGCVMLQQESLGSTDADLVVYFDGDGDRLKLKSRGVVLDGDDILWNLSQGSSQPVVATEMSNQRLIEVLLEQGVTCVRAQVGDHHVYSRMVELGARYGGEPCGHVIDQSWMPLSDPLYILAKLLSAASGSLLPLLNKHYQYQTTVSKDGDIELLQMQAAHPQLRTVIRHSQTEPVIRVLIEGDKALVMSVLPSDARV